jgi:hypothetical protein
MAISIRSRQRELPQERKSSPFIYVLRREQRAKRRARAGAANPVPLKRSWREGGAFSRSSAGAACGAQSRIL